MPRRNRRNRATPRTLPREGTSFVPTREELVRGEIYCVRPMGALAAVKVYTCPACGNLIRESTAHLVVWPKDRVDQRRHWHTYCWERPVGRR